MSFKAINWAFEQPARGVDKLVLLALANFANENTNRCWPSLDRLARMASTQRRTVTRSLTALEALGYIERTRSAGGNSRSTRYLLRVDKQFQQGADVPDEQGADVPPTGTSETQTGGYETSEQGADVPRISINPLKTFTQSCPQCGKDFVSQGTAHSCGPCLMKNAKNKVSYDPYTSALASTRGAA